MSTNMALRRDRGPLSPRRRVEALAAVALARLLARQSPRRVRAALTLARRGAAPASHAEALAARQAVVRASLVCAGAGCLPRSIATALLCRARGVWPTWCLGVRTSPFAAHAWVEAAGRPVDEAFPVGYYRVLIRVPPLGAASGDPTPSGDPTTSHAPGHSPGHAVHRAPGVPA